jgi:hypothetical protein
MMDWLQIINLNPNEQSRQKRSPFRYTLETCPALITQY